MRMEKWYRKKQDVPNGQTPYWEQDIMLPDNGSELTEQSL